MWAEWQVATVRGQAEAMAAYWSRGFFARAFAALIGQPDLGSGRPPGRPQLPLPGEVRKTMPGDKPAYSGPNKAREGVVPPRSPHKLL